MVEILLSHSSNMDVRCEGGFKIGCGYELSGILCVDGERKNKQHLERIIENPDD